MEYMINSRGTQRNCNRNCDKDNTHHRVPELNRFHECIVSRYLARLTRKQFYPDLSWSDVTATAARLCWSRTRMKRVSWSYSRDNLNFPLSSDWSRRRKVLIIVGNIPDPRHHKLAKCYLPCGQLKCWLGTKLHEMCVRAHDAVCAGLVTTPGTEQQREVNYHSFPKSPNIYNII